MKSYLPFLITTEKDAKRILSGQIQFVAAIPEGYCRENYYESIVAESPNYRLGIAEQFKSGAIIDLSDFSSSILTLFQLEYNTEGFIAPDPRLRELGDTVVMITDPIEFFVRLQNANDAKYPELKRLYVRDAVYDDEVYSYNENNDVFNPFIHKNEDSWKKETVIVSRVKELIALDNGVGEGDTFQIPQGIQDIAIMMPITDLYNGKVTDRNLPVNDVVQEKPPVITDTTINVSGSIQSISPQREWIERFQHVFDADHWQPITRMVMSPDGKSAVPCLAFVEKTTGDEVKFMVNTCEFSFHGIHDATFISNTLTCIENEIKTKFCHPSLIIGADMGVVKGQQSKSLEFDLKKSKRVEGMVHWFELRKETLVVTNNFGNYQSEPDHWLLREQMVLPDLTLLYGKDEIMSFIQKASKELTNHLHDLVHKDIVSEIVKE